VISPQEVRALNDRPSEDLRQIMAHCAGICAARDGDGGALISFALERIVSRLRCQPRKTA
jgi:hypothetical protein